MRSLTLLEVVITVSLTAIVAVGVLGLIQSAGDTSSVVHAGSRAQLEAERVLRLMRDQLERTGYTGGGGLTFVPDAATNTWRLDYRLLRDAPFDPANPYAIDWSPEVYSLRWEHPDDPAGGASLGVDDDGDLLVDEGQLALYRDGTLVGVLAREVADIQLTEQPGPRPRIRLQVTVEHILMAAVRDAADLALAPRARHTADLWVVISN